MTANLSDFPAPAMTALGLHAVSADDFLLDLADLDREAMLAVVRRQATVKTRPPLTVGDVLAALARAGVPRFAAHVGAIAN